MFIAQAFHVPGTIVRTVETQQVGLVKSVACDLRCGDIMHEVHFIDFYAVRLGGQSIEQATSEDDRGWYTFDDATAVQ